MCWLGLGNRWSWSGFRGGETLMDRKWNNYPGWEMAS